MQVTLNEETRQPPVHPVTFRGSTAAESYAVVTTLRVPGTDGRPLSLMLRAVRPDGLLAYSAGIDGDFLGVELVDGGQLRVSADDGGGPVTVVSCAGSLADDRWHSVDLVAEEQVADVQNTFYHRRECIARV